MVPGVVSWPSLLQSANWSFILAKLVENSIIIFIAQGVGFHHFFRQVGRLSSCPPSFVLAKLATFRRVWFFRLGDLLVRVAHVFILCAQGHRPTNAAPLGFGFRYRELVRVICGLHNPNGRRELLGGERPPPANQLPTCRRTPTRTGRLLACPPSAFLTNVIYLAKKSFMYLFDNAVGHEPVEQ